MKKQKEFLRQTSLFLFPLLLVLTACSHAPPQINQVFWQVNQVFDPSSSSWSSRLSVFVHAVSADGQKVFDRLHLIQDSQGLFFSLRANQWTTVERPGETWIGAHGLTFPDQKVPVGDWRILVATRAGQKVEARFQVPPQPPDASRLRSAPVVLKQDGKTLGLYHTVGWVDDFVVLSRDSQNNLLSRTKTVGADFQIPLSATSITLYSYDKTRGEGLEAGPFPVKETAKPADR